MNVDLVSAVAENKGARFTKSWQIHGTKNQIVESERKAQRTECIALKCVCVCVYEMKKMRVTEITVKQI